MTTEISRNHPPTTLASKQIEQRLYELQKSQEPFRIDGNFYYAAWMLWQRDGGTKEPSEYLHKKIETFTCSQCGKTEFTSAHDYVQHTNSCIRFRD